MESVEAAERTTAAPRAAMDVPSERARTVGVQRSHHFNAAGSALPTTAVVERVIAHLRREESIGGYEAASQVREEVDGVYAAAATLLGASAAEIALFDSASSGLRVLVEALRPGPGTRLVASRTTYVSHALHLMSLARERGFDLVVAPAAADGRLDVAALETLLADGVPTIVSVAHIPTSSGLVEPAEEIGAVCRRLGATYILDATQSIGQLDVDVRRVGCDVLVTTGRKFVRAPRGTGLAYVARDLLERLAPTAPDVRGASWSAARAWELVDTARRYETWESSVAGRLGLGVALREAIERGPERTQTHLVALGDRMRTQLAAVDGVVIADPPAAASAIVTFCVEGVEAKDAVERLAARNVSVVSVPATHGQWDLGARSLEIVLRASAHVYNDDDDLTRLVEGVASLGDGAGVRA